jgi:amino-acid N-acetyltransferase
LEGAPQGLKEGLAKIHLVNRHINGSLIMELFTNQGQGTVITPEKIEKFRSANIQDAKVIEKMINPLIKTQIIADRSLEKIEMEIQHFHILEFDNKILGCAQVKHYDGISEIACFAINENYQNMGYGKKLLEYCENECKKVNNKTFIMTTQSSHWFMENDFKQGNINDLPDEKKREYSPQRNSKIFLKELEQ